MRPQREGENEVGLKSGRLQSSLPRVVWGQGQCLAPPPWAERGAWPGRQRRPACPPPVCIAPPSPGVWAEGAL